MSKKKYSESNNGRGSDNRFNNQSDLLLRSTVRWAPGAPASAMLNIEGEVVQKLVDFYVILT